MRAAGRLAGEALGGVVAIARGVHHAVGRRVERALPPGARAVATLSSGVAGLVYTGVEQVARAAPAVVTGLMARAHVGAPALTETARGSAVLSAINGLWGDTIASHHPELAVPPLLRAPGADGRLHRLRRAEDVRDPTARLVVFVHGLTENDRSWRGTYARRLRDDLGYSSVYFHYNSGLRVSENGRLLAEELDRLDRLWPVPVERVALVGHSMGGLLARSACRCAEAQGHRWVSAVSTVVTLGTPHLGAPLEKVVHLAERVLGVVPEAAPFARLLAGRSVGVRDLRFGALVEEDRARGDDPGLFQDPCVDVPLLGHATYGFVSASIGRGDRHPVGWLIGDGLVRRPSAAATGRTRRTPLAPHHRVHLSGLHHFNLLDHPDVYEHLRVWLA